MRREAATWAQMLPALPRLLHQALTAKAEPPSRPELEALVAEVRALRRLLWLALAAAVLAYPGWLAVSLVSAQPFHRVLERIAMVVALFGLGCRAFGESREQEAAGKVIEVSNTLSGELSDWSSNIESNNAIRWHMIGRIQRNKARAVARWAAVAHSVDTAPLIATTTAVRRRRHPGRCTHHTAPTAAAVGSAPAR